MKYFPKFVIILVLLTLTLQAADERKMVIRKSGDSALGIVVMEQTGDTVNGAKIIEVIEGSEAEKVGLKAGDVIVVFDGQKISNLDDLQQATGKLNAEKEVKIDLLRDNKTLTFTAKIKPVNKEEFQKQVQVTVSGDDESMAFSTGNNLLWINEDDRKGGFLGVEVKNINDDLKNYFEVKNGVLVEKVIPETPAEKAGLKAGDVITEVSGRVIADHADLVRTMNYYNPGEKVEVRYSRKGKVSTVKVELAEHKMMNKEIRLKHPEVKMMFHGDEGKVKIMELKDQMREFQWESETDGKSSGTTMTKKVLVF
jgi:C-terminal processing protease CtpA/Prc